MIYLSMSGAKAALQRQDTLANNLANVSTNGFRAELTAFRAVPVRGDGSIDADEVKIVGEIGAWLKINGSAIYGTRPWQVYGEGPAMNIFEKGHFDGQQDTSKIPFTPADMRFTQTKNGDTLYVIILALPTKGQVTIKSLAEKSPYWPGRISRVTLVGSRFSLRFNRDHEGLQVQLPEKIPGDIAFAIAIAR